ncbi:sigma-70 family RNA polymerase sigma factor [Neorhodopirellula pilleata]|uniref:ECF RNA polymerase sigma factor SigL n=1 Tax=Neorhodopirellula pilleata TaxID=2714738 RepID=A0A5C6A3X6_9BACT|nr:sigma-70 family RNA polymerase sigma factor [Neorhodopirellula pilleata]TWT93123.1 ECF RNA polymerase sigma factor SigL [Neorhodopirellula pilleata]
MSTRSVDNPSKILNNLQRDKAAGLADLFELQRSHLRHFLKCRLNKVLSNRLDASDVIQEVYIRAQRNVDDYLANPCVPPVIWLRQLAYNVLGDTHRRHFRQLRNPCHEQTDHDEELITNLIDSNDSVNTVCQRNEMADRIRIMLRQLSQVDREVLQLRHLEGYSIAEIADMFELNSETIKKRYYRALKRFRNIIEGDPCMENRCPPSTS